MHNNFKIYYFTDKFNNIELDRLNKKISIIYRNYNKTHNLFDIEKLKKFCKRSNRKFFISDNLKLALKFNTDGLYIPSFNKNLNYNNKSLKKNFEYIGSAHSLTEIKIKYLQGCSQVFLSPLFFNPKNKKKLGITKFSLLSQFAKGKIIALGGINNKNFSNLKALKISGFASISWIKKNGLK